MSLTHKDLTRILEDYAANQIRWTRPLGKDGKPRRNRRNVHLADWLAYIEKRRADRGWPTPSEDEIKERKAEVRRKKLARK